GPLSVPNKGAVRGGDNQYFITHMINWIRENNVYEATYWQNASSAVMSTRNPRSHRAMVDGFGTWEPNTIHTTVTFGSSICGHVVTSTNIRLSACSLPVNIDHGRLVNVTVINHATVPVTLFGPGLQAPTTGRITTFRLRSDASFTLAIFGSSKAQ